MAKNLRDIRGRSRLFFSSPSSALWALLLRSPLPRFYGDSRSIGILNYEEVRASEKPFNSTALFLHGLLGSGRNWKTFSRNLTLELQKSSPTDNWRMVLADLRNHGKSAGIKGLDPPHDMVNAARDLSNLVKFHGWAWPDVVIGHSMGGKVALEFVASCARGDYGESAILPKQLWVLDSVPGEVKTDYSGGEVERILHTLQNLPSSLPSRKWVVDHMLGLGYSNALSQWIGSNLKKEGDHMVWVFNLQAAIEMFNSYWETSYWYLLEHPPKGLEIAIVQAENSDRWSEDVVDRIRSLCRKVERPDEGKVSFHVLPKSGHWVNVDNPKGLIDIMVPHFYSEGS